jgi:hypothetical protein
MRRCLNACNSFIHSRHKNGMAINWVIIIKLDLFISLRTWMNWNFLLPQKLIFACLKTFEQKPSVEKKGIIIHIMSRLCCSSSKQGVNTRWRQTLWSSNTCIHFRNPFLDMFLCSMIALLHPQHFNLHALEPLFFSLLLRWFPSFAFISWSFIKWLVYQQGPKFPVSGGATGRPPHLSFTLLRPPACLTQILMLKKIGACHMIWCCEVQNVSSCYLSSWCVCCVCDNVT